MLICVGTPPNTHAGSRCEPEWRSEPPQYHLSGLIVSVIAPRPHLPKLRVFPETKDFINHQLCVLLCVAVGNNSMLSGSSCLHSALGRFPPQLLNSKEETATEPQKYLDALCLLKHLMWVSVNKMTTEYSNVHQWLWLKLMVPKIH